METWKYVHVKHEMIENISQKLRIKWNFELTVFELSMFELTVSDL